MKHSIQNSATSAAIGKDLSPLAFVLAAARTGFFGDASERFPALIAALRADGRPERADAVQALADMWPDVCASGRMDQILGMMEGGVLFGE